MEDYRDIIDLPHHVSERHRPLSMEQRAAQFLPFQSLTGYGDVIQETGRLTQEDVTLTEDEREQLDLALRQAMEDGTPVRVTYFVPDARKEGGAMEEKTGIVRRIDDDRNLVFSDGEKIPAEAVRDLKEA